jgi:predicted nucleotidyltransferase
MHPLIEANLNKIEALCKKHFIKHLYLFGSTARGDYNGKSDFDFAYVFDYYEEFLSEPNVNKWRYDPSIEFDNFKSSLKKLLKRKVDLIPYNRLTNPYFKQSVDEDKIMLYAKEKPEAVLA